MLCCRIRAENITKKPTYESYEHIIGEALGNTPLGKVWLPTDRVFLGREAGWATQQILLRGRQHGAGCVQGAARRTTAAEIAFFLARKLSRWLRHVPEILKDHTVQRLLETFCRVRRTSITTPRTLLDSLLV